MNVQSNKVHRLVMLLASGSPGSAAAWLHHAEIEQGRHRQIKADDAVSDIARQVEQRGKKFNFFP